MTLSQRISSVIKTHREYKGHQSKDVAEAAGYSKAMYSQLENGNRALTVDGLERISDALGIAPSTRLYGVLRK